MFLSLILGFDIVVTLYLKAIWSLMSKMCFSPIGGDCYSLDVWEYTYTVLPEGTVRRRFRFHYSVFNRKMLTDISHWMFNIQELLFFVKPKRFFCVCLFVNCYMLKAKDQVGPSNLNDCFGFKFISYEPFCTVFTAWDKVFSVPSVLFLPPPTV